MSSLILFDIDGTLVGGCGEGIGAFVEAIEDICKVRISPGYDDTAGKTDRLILRELLEKEGLVSAEVVEQRLLSRYLQGVSAMIGGKPGQVLPGVPRLLKRLAEDDDLVIGLGTGNLEAVARLKLRLHGIDAFFKTGGFADDALYRKDVIAAGIRKTQDEYGIAFQRIIVVGDTPRDVEAARANGVYSLAVASGLYSVSTLKSYNPTLVIRDLSDPEMFIRLVQKLPPLYR